MTQADPDNGHPPPRDDDLNYTSVRIHLIGGQTFDTFLDESDVEAEDVKEMVDFLRPRWAIVGDAVVFTQAVSAIEVL